MHSIIVFLQNLLHWKKGSMVVVAPEKKTVRILTSDEVMFLNSSWLISPFDKDNHFITFGEINFTNEFRKSIRNRLVIQISEFLRSDEVGGWYKIVLHDGMIAVNSDSKSWDNKIGKPQYHFDCDYDNTHTSWEVIWDYMLPLVLHMLDNYQLSNTTILVEKTPDKICLRCDRDEWLMAMAM